LVGVPLIVAPVRVSPSGSAPEIDQLYGPVPPMATSDRVYGTPTVLAGADVVEIVRGAAPTKSAGVIVVLAGVGVALSVAFTVSGNLPSAVADTVPLIAGPVADSPDGKPLMLHVYGPVPPPTLNVRLYGAPAVAGGTDVGEIVSGAALTTMFGLIVTLRGV